MLSFAKLSDEGNNEKKQYYTYYYKKLKTVKIEGKTSLSAHFYIENQ